MGQLKTISGEAGGSRERGIGRVHTKLLGGKKCLLTSTFQRKENLFELEIVIFFFLLDCWMRVDEQVRTGRPKRAAKRLLSLKREKEASKNEPMFS